MAAQDLIISRRGAALPSAYLDPDSLSTDGPDGAAILAATLRKRWLLLLVIAVASGGLAVLACLQFGSNTADIKSALIYTGLPDSAAQASREQLGPATGAEMVVSTQILNQLIARRGMELTPSSLAQRIQPAAGRSSSLLNLTLTWQNADEGIAVLNDLMNIFIEGMAAQRKRIQQEHLQHLEMSLLQAQASVGEARDHAEALRKQQQQQLDKGGLTSEQYRTALTKVASAESAVENKKIEQIGIEQQIEALGLLIAATDKNQQDSERELKQDFLRETSDVFKAAQSRYSASSSSARQLTETIARITKFAKSNDAPQVIDRWEKALAQEIEAKSNGLSSEDVKNLGSVYESLHTEYAAKFSDFVSKRQRLDDQREQLLLRLIPLKSLVAMLEQQRVANEKDAQKLGEQITGISSAELNAATSEVDEAGKRQNILAVQRDSLRQLAESRLREWTVSAPASPETTQLRSNRAKLFVLVFAFCGLVFSAPLLVAEWHTQSGSPQMQFARSLRLPVLAEKILDDFSPVQRRANAEARFTAEKMETVRMLTLRIQQSCHNPGSVVLFSSLDSNYSVAPLMAGVAECLAEREERVLLVDAVSPDRALLPVTNLLPQGSSAPLASGKQSQSTTHALAANAAARGGGPGLSEFLHEECDDIGELIRPTGCPGVDLISSGRVGFAREALASSCLTQLLGKCRKNYTIVLVNGPAFNFTADLQMLTARADGIILAATKSVGKDPRARAVVEDLIELGAPIIGLVA